MKPSTGIVVTVGIVLTLHTLASLVSHDQLAAMRGSLNMIAMLLAVMVAIQMERGSSWNG